MVGETAFAASLAGATGFAAWAVRGRSSSIFAASHWEGTRTRPSVALTFDDGPSESTEDMLEVLDRYGVQATFFQCGANVRRLPQVSRLVLELGHEIGNHSENHPTFYFRSRKFIHKEMAAAQRTFEDTLGVRPKLFRAPFGVRWFGVGGAQRKLGLTGVMWSCLALDWRLGSTAIAARCIEAARSGAILCLHDGRELQSRPNVRPAIEAVKRIVPELLERGFEFETASSILSPVRLP
jgi:peptidoglycan/xylan/chitin deacetylase (PgdA/CDA1 family)